MQLSARRERVVHELALALVFVDHFGGRTIDEVLALRVLPAGVRPTPAADGSLRHVDGSYRFIDLAPGRYGVDARSPSGRWTRWSPPRVLDLPLSEPTSALVDELWPTPATPDIAGLTALRGKLGGRLPVGLVVELRPVGADWSGRWTKTDAYGEFFVPLREYVEPDASGRLRMELRVAGGTRAVAGGEVVRGAATSSFIGPQFSIDPGRTTRVTFALMNP